MKLVEPLSWLLYINVSIKAATRQFLDEMTPLQGATPMEGQTTILIFPFSYTLLPRTLWCSLTIFGQDWMDFEGSVNMYLENQFPFENCQSENKTI